MNGLKFSLIMAVILSVVVGSGQIAKKIWMSTMNLFLKAYLVTLGVFGGSATIIVILNALLIFEDRQVTKHMIAQRKKVIKAEDKDLDVCGVCGKDHPYMH